MNNIAQLRDTINAAYRAVWYFRRDTWFYGYRWLEIVLQHLELDLQENEAILNAVTLIRGAVVKEDMMLAADYLERALLPELLSVQAGLLADAGEPTADNLIFEHNLRALSERYLDIVNRVVGEDLVKVCLDDIRTDRHLSADQTERINECRKKILEQGYSVEWTASGDLTVGLQGRYLSGNNTPVYDAMQWAVSETTDENGFFRETQTALLYRVQALRELFPERKVTVAVRDDALFFLLMCSLPLAELFYDGGILFISAEDEKAEPKQPSLGRGTSPKRVSIIIPCYNALLYLERCLNSVLNQTIGLDRLEIICVDDASTDDTLQVLREVQARVPRSMKVIACKENGRQGRARNIGIRHATAEYVMFLDADDWLDASTCEEMLAVAEQTNVELVAGGFQRETVDGHILKTEGYSGEAFVAHYVKTTEDRKTLMQHGLHSNVVCKLYRREIFDRYDLFFPEGITYEDNFFGPLLRYVIESYYILEKPFYHWIYNPSSTSADRNSPHHFDRLIVEEMKLRELEKRGFTNGDFADDIQRDFCQKYYLNSLHIFFTRFDTPPYEKLDEACEGLRKRYPDLPKSEYYKGQNSLMRSLIDIAYGESVSHAEWDYMMQQYVDIVSQ